MLDHKKYNILLVYNEGTLEKKTSKRLSEYYKVIKYLINKNYSLKKLKYNFFSLVTNKKIDIVLYLSGETVNQNNMFKLNYELPSAIAEYCSKNSIPLVYLSSLSVYGIPRNKYLHNLTKREPFNIYGKTKNKFDENLIKNLPNLRFCAIAPGTIIKPSSKRNNLLEKVIKNFSYQPLKFISKIIVPAGNFACVHIEDLTISILNECHNILNYKLGYDYQLFKNCSTKISIYELVKYKFKFIPILKLPSISTRLINFILSNFDKNFNMKFIVYFCDITYKEDYDYLKKRKISDYL